MMLLEIWDSATGETDRHMVSICQWASDYMISAVILELEFERLFPDGGEEWTFEGWGYMPSDVIGDTLHAVSRSDSYWGAGHTLTAKLIPKE